MDYMFTFKKEKLNKDLMKTTQEKMGRIIRKYCRKPLDAHITLSKEGDDYHSLCRFKAGEGLSCEVLSLSQDLQSSIDLMLQKFEGILKRKKEKLRGHHHKVHQKFAKKDVANPNKSIFDRDWDTIPIDAADVIKYEKSRIKKHGS